MLTKNSLKKKKVGTLKISSMLSEFVDLESVVSYVLRIKGLVLIFMSLVYQNLQFYLSNNLIMLVTFQKGTCFANYNSHIYLLF